MNGQFLGCRSIRTNWASRKPPAKTEGKPIITFSYDPLRTFFLLAFAIYAYHMSWLFPTNKKYKEEEKKSSVSCQEK